MSSMSVVLYICSYREHHASRSVVRLFLQATSCFMFSCTSVLTGSITLHVQLYIYSYKQHHVSHSVVLLFLQATSCFMFSCTSVLTGNVMLHVQLYFCSYRQHHASCSVAPLRTDTEMLLDIRCVKSGDTKLFSWCIVFGNYAIFSVDKNVKKQPNCELCKNNKCHTGAALHCCLRSSVQVMCWCSCQLASQKITSCCFGIRGFT
jgi:hypothetical protein